MRADSYGFEPGVRGDKPLDTVGLEIYLDARVFAAAFEMQHDALAETLVRDALPQGQPGRCRRFGDAAADRTADPPRRTSLSSFAGISRMNRDGCG